jgi:Ran-binding protein 3
VTTGEEDEETLYHVRSKLFTLDSTNNSWAERGKGVLRLNVRRDDGAGARLGKTSTVLLTTSVVNFIERC